MIYQLLTPLIRFEKAFNLLLTENMECVGHWVGTVTYEMRLSVCAHWQGWWRIKLEMVVKTKLDLRPVKFI